MTKIHRQREIVIQHLHTTVTERVRSEKVSNLASEAKKYSTSLSLPTGASVVSSASTVPQNVPTAPRWSVYKAMAANVNASTRKHNTRNLLHVKMPLLLFECWTI